MNLIGVDLTANDSVAQYALGQIYETVGGKRYRYVQFNNGVGNVAAVAGNFAYVYAVSGASDGQTTIVTMDLTDCAEVGAGVFQAVLTDLYYGWVQIAGYATLTTALTAGGDGDPLTPTGATDGTLDLATAITDHICATAIDATAKIVLLHSMG
jgi:hypothetical protein